MSDYIQLDTSKTIVGGVNIAEAIQSNKKLVLNESYVIAGEALTAPSIYACYDLTVIGDIEVEEMEVRGNLYVIGNIKAKQLSCLKAIICSGDISAETVLASEVQANNIVCHDVTCSGNIVVRIAIDVNESLKTEKSVIAGEGILGSGQFKATNAIAAEYFDFAGEVESKVLELETMANDPHHATLSEEETFDAFSVKLKEKIANKLKEAGEVDEDQLIELVNQLSVIDEDMLADWKSLTEDLVELSYLDKVVNLRDYLIIVMAKKYLPEEIVGYETIEHVFKSLLSEAEKELASLPFRAKDIKDFAYALKIATLCDKELKIDKDEVFDRIFQSIGIKYKTVKAFLG